MGGGRSPDDGVQQSLNRDPPASLFAAAMAEAARARSRRTREDVVGILMMIVVDVPVLGSSIRWVGGSSSIRAQKRLVTLWK